MPYHRPFSIGREMSYHDKKFKKCPWCDSECKRNIVQGRNKGHYRTCGSVACVYKAGNNPEVNSRKRHVGENHPRWISDRTKVKFRPRHELTIWTKAVFERDNFVCQNCGKRGNRLQAHHIRGYAQYPELRWDVDNGLTLCVDCHKQTDNYGSRGRPRAEY